MNDLTEQYEFIKQYDELAAEVYYDRKYFLTYNEIAAHRGIKVSEAKDKYSLAKKMLRNPDSAWMTGLSNHAKNKLVSNGYTEMKRLLDDVLNETIDLECLKGIGHQAAVEIRRWCVRKRSP